jgi:hypothetical protein
MAGLHGWSIILRSSFICPQDTFLCGDDASPHNVNDVVIGSGKRHSPGRSHKLPAGAVVEVSGGLEQIEFLGAVDCRPAVVDPQFGEYVFGVSAQGVERHNQLLGNFWSAQFAAQQLKHFQLAFA